jgi:hypothetical protein
MPRKAKAEKSFALEDHLVLAQTIASKLGIERLDEIEFFSKNSEKYEKDGRSKMHHRILRKPGHWKLPESVLQKYETNIEKHLNNIRKTWGPSLNLKYYQYLAAIFAEIYLDHYFAGPLRFNKTLNKWNKNRGSEESIPRSKIRNKLAYWMATGSGKTLIMHLNILQFLEYNKGLNKLDFENIILVTSNDKMSEQHKKDFQKSGISADLIDGTTRRASSQKKNSVKIISISKLKLPGEQSGDGVTIDVSEFGTKNLVFIDEGHKGQKSEKAIWKTVREKLAEDGFIWEYSATFGQTISSKQSPYFNEYRYSILFDYSYKYFHKDGYGKDFHIINLKTTEFKDKFVPTLMIANTISYYEQLRIYSNPRFHQEYNIEKPLWIFVGSKVKRENSDIHQVIRFLNHILQTESKNIIGEIEKILEGRSGIPGLNDKDAFARSFPEKNFTYLRDENIESDEIYYGILKEVFNIKARGTSQKLELYDLKNVDGEIGLRASSSKDYFGVINIGDKSSFLKMVRETTPEIVVNDDPFSDSLFDSIDKKESKINLLLGAKKFIEGWNSWRVSNMCLLNVGKNEGPQIIQLFGRGVRLLGQEKSLKRSEYMPGNHPKYIDVLETLNIYGIHANYLKDFQEYIDREVKPSYHLGINTWTDHLKPFPEDLYTITLEEEYNFKDYLFTFDHREFLENNQFPIIDLLPQTDIIDSRLNESISATQKKTEQMIEKSILELLDWDEIYHEILKYKRTKGISNISINKESLKPILEQNKYVLYCDPLLIAPLQFSDLWKTQEVVLRILKTCIDKYYSKKRLGEEKKHIILIPVRDAADRLVEKYEVVIKTDNPGVVTLVTDIVHNINSTQTRLSGKYLNQAYFSKHLYQPLLSQSTTTEVTLKPTGLNFGETKFVRDLEKHLENNTFLSEIFLLRNLTKGKGVGFFDENSFYPDFILWVKKDNTQKIVFIDPKGIVYYSINHPKLSLHMHLQREVQPQIVEPGITLDAFILSVTPFDQFRNRVNKSLKFLAEEHHLLFMKLVGDRENPNYMKTLFSILEVD